MVVKTEPFNSDETSCSITGREFDWLGDYQFLKVDPGPSVRDNKVPVKLYNLKQMLLHKDHSANIEK